MTDTSTIQGQINLILAAQQERDSAAAVARQADEARCAALDAAKARCNAECGEVQVALAAATEPNVREALVQLEQQTHTSHKDDLELAYLVFSGQREGESNPAPPGETSLEARATVAMEASS